MKAQGLFDRRWLRAFFIIGVWTLFGVFLASQSTLAFSRRDRPFSWQRILLVEMAFAYIWAVLTPPVLWLARRFPIERGRLPRPRLYRHRLCDAGLPRFDVRLLRIGL